MKRSSEDIVAELKKRTPDKALSLSELATLRDINYIYYKKEKCAIELLAKVCEKAFLMTTIVPLLQFENPVEVIKGGAWLIACLSQNSETHKKIIKSECLKTLSSLILKSIHHDITKQGLQTMSNLCCHSANFTKILELQFLNFVIENLLQTLPNASQLYVLKILLQMTALDVVHVDKDTLIRMLLKKRFIRPILRSMVSSDIDVAQYAVQTLKYLYVHIVSNLVHDGKHFKRVQRLNLPTKLLLTHQLFQNHEDTIKIKKAVMLSMENLLKVKYFQRELCQDEYYALCLGMFDTSNYELNLLGITCIAFMSEMVESHDRLVDKKVLDLIFQILKECKDQKIRQQAFKIISCISLNPKYLQNLIDIKMINLLVNSLNSDEKACKIYSILSLSNLSCSQNFHQYIKDINIKLLIHILESADPSNHAVLRAAANTLANISIDHNYQSWFLKDPEKNIVLKLLYTAQDIILVKSIIIIFTNISTNNTLLSELAQPDIIECLFLLYSRDYEEIRGYLSRCLSALAIIPECRRLVLQKGFMKSLVSSIYKSNKETKRMVLLSIMMMLSYSEEFQRQFIMENGTECLLYLMGQNDNFHAYIAAKCFVLISRVESSLQKVARRSTCKSIAEQSLPKERRILKEGLRFFVNIIIHKRPKPFIIEHLCSLAHEVLKGVEEDAIQLGLFSFMLVSEYHETLMNNDSLLLTIAQKSIKDLKKENGVFLSIAIMNLSLNVLNLEKLLQLGFPRIMKDLCITLGQNEDLETEFDFRTYLFTFIRQMLRMDNLDKHMPTLFQQGTTTIVQQLLAYNKQYFFRNLLECINIMISINDSYPQELLQVIVHLADPEYQPQDEESIPLRVYVLNRMSYNPLVLIISICMQSLEHFKSSRVVSFLKEKMQNDNQFVFISQYFCSLLANISKENSILNNIFENELLNVIFKVRQFKNNIKLTDIIRLLAHLSSHPLFKPQIFNEEIYSNIFDHLQQVTFQKQKSDPTVYYPVLICILNMTKSDYGLIRAIVRSNIFQFIKIYMKEIQQNQAPRHIAFLCYLTISNMLIDPSILEQKEAELLPLIENLRVQVECSKREESSQGGSPLRLKDATTPKAQALSSFEPAEQLGSSSYMVIAFLRVMHNLVLCHYKAVEESDIVRSCMKEVLSIFLSSSKQEVLGLIVSIFCVMVESPNSLAQLKTNYPVMIKLFDLLHNSYEKLDSIEQRFRTSLLLFLANLTYHEHSFDFFETFLNIEDFMVKFRVAYLALNSHIDRELLLTIMVNLTFIKEIQLIMPKYEKTLHLLRDIFLQEQDEGATKRIIQLLANLSLNSDLHAWIASEDILKRLHKLFFESSTMKPLKEQIQILISNTTFTEEVHEILIKNDAIRIFEQIVNKRESIQQETSHQQVVSLVNLGLNVQTYYLIEGQFNMVNSLSLLDECEKPLQVRILKSALDYVVDVRGAKPKSVESAAQNRKEILQQIMVNINIMLESRSKFIVCKIDPLWSQILQSELLSKVRFDKERLLENFVTIIIHFDQLDVQCNYYGYLCELTDKLPSILETSLASHLFMERLMVYNQQILARLKDLHLQMKQKLTVDKYILQKNELLINLYLRLLSNCAFACKNNINLTVFLQRKDLDDLLYDILSFSHQTCQALMLQSIASYANILQQDNLYQKFNHSTIFLVIQKNYKQNIKHFPLYQHFLNGLIVAVMKNRKFLLQCETNLNNASAITGSQVHTQKNNLNVYPEDRGNNIEISKLDSSDSSVSLGMVNPSPLSQKSPTIKRTTTNNNNNNKDTFFKPASQGTFNHTLSIRSQESEQKSSLLVNTTLSKDSHLVVAFLIYVLKKGRLSVPQPASALSLQCLTNIIYNLENHRFIYATKIPEHLFAYIQQRENMLAEGYEHAITSFINMGTSREFFQRVPAEEIFKFVVKLNAVNPQLVVQYSSCMFMQMFEHNDIDEIQHLVEFTLDFLVNEVLMEVPFESEHMDMFLSFLERLLSVPKLKFKIAKIDSLFVKFQKILEAQDPSNQPKFDRYWRLWNVYQFFINSKECLNYLIKYGFFSLLLQKISYFTSSSFDSITTKSDADKHAFTMKQLQLFSLCLQSVERVFKAELNLKLQPPIHKLIFSQKIDKLTDAKQIDSSLKICFHVPFALIDKIIASEFTFTLIQSVRTIVELLNQIAQLLFRMDSNGDMTFKFVIELLTRTQKNVLALMDIEDKTFFYSNTLSICVKLFEKFGVEQQIEEALVLLIQHWSCQDYRFMTLEAYLNFLKICVLFKIKDCQHEKPSSLANNLLQIMIVNQTTFREQEAQILFQMFIKKLIAEIDPVENAELEETIQEAIDFLLEYIQKQSSQIKAQLESHNRLQVKSDKPPQLDALKNEPSEYQKNLNSQNFIMSIEILTILASFQTFQDKILQLELVSSTLSCGLLVQKLLAYLEDKSDPPLDSETVKTSPDITQLESFIKHISIFLSYISFLIRFHEDLANKNCRQFIFENLYRRKKQTKIFCFNILVNLIESLGPSFLFDVLEGVEDLIDTLNCSDKAQRFQLDAIVSLIEEIFNKVKDYQTDDIGYSHEQLTEDLCILLTKALVGKKHQFLLGSSLDILLASQCSTVTLRVLFMIIRRNINSDLSAQIRDRVITYAIAQVKCIYGELRSMTHISCTQENVEDPRHQPNLLNIKQIWEVLRKTTTKPMTDLQELFFWEEFELSPIQLKLLQLIMAFEVLSTRYRTDNNLPRPNQPTSPALIQQLLMLMHGGAIEEFDVQTQPDFLLMYYIASIIYSSLGTKTKKGDFQQICEQDASFTDKMTDFVTRLSDSKINILMNFADLIKNPVQALTTQTQNN